MKDELAHSLYNEFPKLFGTAIDPNTRTGIHWGIETGDGWYELIRECAAKLEVINDTISNPQNYITVAQIKEKFGQLRFYINTSMSSGLGENEYIKVNEAVDEAEHKSSIICETCGKPGKIRQNRRWLHTACEEHK